MSAQKRGKKRYASILSHLEPSTVLISAAEILPHRFHTALKSTLNHSAQVHHLGQMLDPALTRAKVCVGTEEPFNVGAFSQAEHLFVAALSHAMQQSAIAVYQWLRNECLRVRVGALRETDIQDCGMLKPKLFSVEVS
jgi:hypothetical protein